MQEIWIPELLIVVFLFLHIIQPLVKKLKPINGLVWLPLLASLIILALIPAYGLRPEIIPLFLFAVIMAITGFFRHQRDSVSFRVFRETNIIAVCILLVLLMAAGGLTFYFTPRKDTAFDIQGMYSQKICSGTADEKEYFLHIYSAENNNSSAKRPLLVLLPPVTGSHAVVDLVARELKNRGFTVLTYSRRNFDSPAIFIHRDGSKPDRYGINPIEQLHRLNAFTSGTVSAKANVRGRALEESRRDDAAFLLSYIRENPRIGDVTLFDIASRDAVFLAGYDAGGSALILSSNSFAPAAAQGNNLSGRFSSPGQIRIRGIIAIESPLWSLYREEAAEEPVLPPNAGWFQSVQHGFKTWLTERRPKKISVQ